MPGTSAHIPFSRRAFLHAGAATVGAAALADPALVGAQDEPKPGTLQVGFGAADITPDVGMEMPGGFLKAVGKGVRDRLYAVACVVSDGKTPVALVGTDTLAIARPTVEAARRKIAQDTRILGDNVLIGASHTHSGGPAVGVHGSEGDAVYLARLADGVAAAVTTAWQSLQPGEIGIGTGREDSISFNRRFLMRDGREITHPGKPGTPHHAEIVRPAGPIDPDVGVLAARDPKGKVVGVVVNFACHSTVVGGNQFSADYAGFLRKHLQDRYGERTPVVFLLGACGDITQVNNLTPGSDFGPEHADMLGMKLAAEAERTIRGMTWLKEATTGSVTESALLSIRPEPDVDRERPAFGLGSGPTVEPVYEQGRAAVAELRRKTPKVPTEVLGIRIGPLGVVSNGSEYFCEFGLRIKQCSPFATTWVVSLANDVLGYVPMPQAFAGGGYVSRTTAWRRFRMDAGQVLLETGLKALNRAKG